MENNRPDENPVGAEGEKRNLDNIETKTPIVVACFLVLRRLVLFSLLYLCYISFPTLWDTSALSLVSTTLANFGFPEWLVSYPGSGPGAIASWSLSTTIIVTALDFIHGFSTRLADSISLAVHSSEVNKPTRAVSLLVSISQILFPIWMEMDKVVLGYGLVWFLARFAPLDWQIAQSLSKLDLSLLYWAFLPFVVYIALWVLYATLETLWHDLFWRVFVMVSYRVSLRVLVQIAIYLGYSDGFSNTQMFSLYIARLPRDIFGWPVNYTVLRYCLVGLTRMRFEEILEWSYALLSLLMNVWHLLDTHILPELSPKVL
ncbi:hypothetical protein F5Y09DRAFT_351333 [Xylaria sp. FL1042]|nr:hypothetical protein F5Y09DRAFT_351333 [Xylaria sp. FL1042]